MGVIAGGQVGEFRDPLVGPEAAIDNGCFADDSVGHTGAEAADTAATLCATTTQEVNAMAERDLLRFNALRNALYHTARRRFLERLGRLFNFIVILLGAAAVGDFVSFLSIPHPQQAIGLVVAFVGALQLVFDFGRQARDHQVLQRDYYTLLADMDRVTVPTDEKLAEWRGKLTVINADEPPVLRAIDAKAYNDAVDAMEFDRGERLIIPLHLSVFGPFIAFEGHEFVKVCERNAKK